MYRPQDLYTLERDDEFKIIISMKDKEECLEQLKKLELPDRIMDI